MNNTEYEYITLESAMTRILEDIAAHNEKKWALLVNFDYARRIFGAPHGMLVTNRRNFEGFYDKSVALNGKRYFFYTYLSTEAFLTLCSWAEEVGEKYARPDRLADWGFKCSDMAALERARIRREERRRIENERLEKEKAEKARKAKRNPFQDGACPNEVRNYIVGILAQDDNRIMELASSEYCKNALGLSSPVLLRTQEVMKMRRFKNDERQFWYTRLIVELNGMQYNVKALTPEEFSRLRGAMAA